MEDSRRCPACREVYGKGRKRKLTDMCGHARCYECLFIGSCPLCPVVSGETATATDGDPIMEETMQKRNDDAVGTAEGLVSGTPASVLLASGSGTEGGGDGIRQDPDEKCCAAEDVPSCAGSGRENHKARQDGLGNHRARLEQFSGGINVDSEWKNAGTTKEMCSVLPGKKSQVEREMSNVEVFSCEPCGIDFSSESAWDEHVLKHTTTDKQGTQDLEPGECGTEYSAGDTLAHSDVHEGDATEYSAGGTVAHSDAHEGDSTEYSAGGTVAHSDVHKGDATEYSAGGTVAHSNVHESDSTKTDALQHQDCTVSHTIQNSTESTNTGLHLKESQVDTIQEKKNETVANDNKTASFPKKRKRTSFLLADAKNKSNNVEEIQEQPIPTGKNKALKLKLKLYSFECDQCGKTFSRKCHLANHVKTHNNEKKDNEETKTHKNEEETYNNEKKTHNEETKTDNKVKKTCSREKKTRKPQKKKKKTSYDCRRCLAKFKDKEERDKHKPLCAFDRAQEVRQTEEIMEFNCDECGKMFASKEKLVVHKYIHTRKRVYPCSYCGKQNATKQLLEVHERVHSGERPYNCKMCEKAFKDYSSLRAHVAVHSDERPFICTVCGKTFRFRNVLRRHKKLHTDAKEHQCETCGARFRETHGLRRHRMTHAETRPYPCRHCAKSFTTPHDRKNHEHMHQTGKPYECDVCGRPFMHLSSLGKHKRAKHDPTAGVLCYICGKHFVFNWQLKKHEEKEHPPNMEYGEPVAKVRKPYVRNPNPTKDFVCHVCGKRFSARRTLLRHGHVHNPNPKYSCKVCGRAFAGKWNVKKHMENKHSTVKPDSELPPDILVM